MYVCMYVCMYVYMYVCMCVCVCVCVCVCYFLVYHFLKAGHTTCKEIKTVNRLTKEVTKEQVEGR